MPARPASPAFRPTGAPRDYIDGIRQICRRDAEKVTAHLHFPGLDRWLPLLYPDAESILDFVLQDDARALVFLDEPLRFRNRLDAAQADLDEHVKNLMTKGQVLPLASQAALPRRRHQHPPGQGRPRDRPVPDRLLRQWPARRAEQVQITGRPADSYRGREDQLLVTADCTSCRQRAARWSSSPARKPGRPACTRLLLDAGLDIPVVARAACRAASSGRPPASLAIGTQDIFGSERPARRRHQAGIAHRPVQRPRPRRMGRARGARHRPL